MKILSKINTLKGERCVLFFLLFSFFFVIGQGSVHAQSEKEIFDRARLALFDRQWDEAFSQLERLTRTYPNTTYQAQAQFYKGKCQQEKNNPAKALEYYNAFLLVSDNPSLKEEALIAIIDLNFQLYSRGQKGAIEKIMNLLQRSMRTVQYYAAFKLSYARDKVIAAKAVPMLKQMVREESDAALVDRAKIALMRIGPQYVKALSRSKNLDNAMLFIRVYDKKNKRETFSFTIPFALANLALDAIPDEDKKKLQKGGYSMDKLLQTVINTQNLIKIDEDDVIFEIGIK